MSKPNLKERKMTNFGRMTREEFDVILDVALKPIESMIKIINQVSHDLIEVSKECNEHKDGINKKVE